MNLKEAEKKYNTPPQKWFVPYGIKIGCFVLFLVLCVTYAAFIVHRKNRQSRYIHEHNQTQTADILNLTGINFATKQEENLLGNHDFWIVLKVWVSNCSACLEDLPSLEIIARDVYPHMKVIGLCADHEPTMAQTLIKENHYQISHYWDNKDFTTKMLKVQHFPQTFIISPTGKIIKQFTGKMPLSANEILDLRVKNF